jgi:hypothetical protein
MQRRGVVCAESGRIGVDAALSDSVRSRRPAPACAALPRLVWSEFQPLQPSMPFPSTQTLRRALLMPALLAAVGATAANVADGAPRGPGTTARLGAAAGPVQMLWRWVRDSGDARGVPFAIVDKRGARLWVFDAAGAPLGDAPVLLGLARGDNSVTGIGERALADIQPLERTTPAGRFAVEAGFNAKGEDIFWNAYSAAVSRHRLRAVHASERRAQRMASPSAADNRITYGCINVPLAFYDARLRPAFARGAVVYVLPDTLPLRSVFAALR